MRKLLILILCVVAPTLCFASGNDANTLLLLHCDGADASTTFTDASVGGAHGNASVTSDMAVDTAQKKFGTGSALNSSGNMYYADDPDWDLPTTFTIDLWVRFSSLSDIGFVDRGTTANYTFGYSVSRGNKLHFWTAGGYGPIERDWTPNVNQWYHVAVTRRSNSDVRLFIDGVQQGSEVTDGTSLAGAQALYIGAWGGGSRPMVGWMDEIRISNIERWTANFTPPDAPYDDQPAGGVGRVIVVN